MNSTAARRALIGCARALNPLGINQGKSGNVSVRSALRGRPGFLITPTGLAYDALTPADIVWVELGAARHATGRAIGARAPSSEWRFHHDIYAERATAHAIVHTHASFATTLACLPAIQRHGIPAFHYMIAIAGGDSIRCARYATFGTQALSNHALDALTDRQACLLANHGMIALGGDLTKALAVAVEVESLCKTYWQSLQIGKPTTLGAAEMRRVIAKFATYGQPQAKPTHQG